MPPNSGLPQGLDHGVTCSMTISLYHSVACRTTKAIPPKHGEQNIADRFLAVSAVGGGDAEDHGQAAGEQGEGHQR